MHDYSFFHPSYTFILSNRIKVNQKLINMHKRNKNRTNKIFYQAETFNHNLSSNTIPASDPVETNLT